MTSSQLLRTKVWVDTLSSPYDEQDENGNKYLIDLSEATEPKMAIDTTEFDQREETINKNNNSNTQNKERKTGVQNAAYQYNNDEITNIGIIKNVPNGDVNNVIADPRLPLAIPKDWTNATFLPDNSEADANGFYQRRDYMFPNNESSKKAKGFILQSNNTQENSKQDSKKTNGFIPNAKAKHVQDKKGNGYIPNTITKLDIKANGVIPNGNFTQFKIPGDTLKSNSSIFRNEILYRDRPIYLPEAKDIEQKDDTSKRNDDNNDLHDHATVNTGLVGKFKISESPVKDRPNYSYFTEKPIASTSSEIAPSTSNANELSPESNNGTQNESNTHPFEIPHDRTSSLSQISDQFRFLEEEEIETLSADLCSEPGDQVVVDIGEIDIGVSDESLPEKEDQSADLYVHLHITKELLERYREEKDALSAEDELAVQRMIAEEKARKKQKKRNRKKKPVVKSSNMEELFTPLENIESRMDPTTNSDDVINDDAARIITSDLPPGVVEGMGNVDTDVEKNEDELTIEKPKAKIDESEQLVKISRYLPRVKKKQAANVTLGFRIFYISMSISLVIGLMLVFYALNIRLVRVGLGTLPWAQTVYGLVTMAHYISETFFAVFNKFKMSRLGRKVQGVKRASYRCKGKVALQIVGYREDPDYFRNCILTARDCHGPIYVMIVVVDGHEEKDAYMAEIVTEVFGPDVTMQIILDELAAKIDEDAWQELVVKPVADYLGDGSEYTGALREDGEEITHKVIAIRQLHEGKRSAMHCAMRLLIDLGLDYIMMTDSDTLLDPDCIAHLSNLIESDSSLGAVTGNVGIFNANESPISYLSAVKYWYAFNIERSAQSLFGVVSCVSGPLGLYRAKDVETVLHEWYFQKFLGVPCTYGDDRHLTNRILSLGKNVKFTHLATCTTETPTNLIRWIVQQTRWTKSFFRELGFNLMWAFKVNFYLTWVLLYQGIYPFFVLASIVTLLFSNSPNSIGTLLVVMVCVSSARAVLAFAIAKQPRLLIYSIYSFLYVLFLIPTKVHAVLMLWDTGWGTSSRLTVKNGNPIHLIPMCLWSSLIVGGVTYNFITNLFTGSSYNSTLNFNPDLLLNETSDGQLQNFTLGL